MSRITPLYLILALLVVFTVSCSGGNGGITTPDIPYQEVQKEAKVSKGSKVVGGIWHIDIDEVTGEVGIANLRNSQLIINVLGFLEPPVLTGVTIDLDSLVINEPIIEADVILTHPIPDPVFMGFDVRGVVFGPKVANADGLTILTGPEYFKGEPFGYIDGLLGAPDSYANYEGLFGYRYFCDGLDKDADLAQFMSVPGNLAKRGLFKHAPNFNKRHYVLDWEGSGQNFTVFNYAVYANYDWPTSPGPPTGVDDFSIISANSAEAFCCKVTETATSLWSLGGIGGGSISLDVEIWDWQGDIADVTMESTSAGIAQTSYTTAGGQGTTDYSYVYSFEEIPGNPTAPGEHEILITVTDPQTFGGYWFFDLLTQTNPMYDERVYNCFIHTTTVSEAPPVEVYSIDPDTGETSTYLADVMITGDSFDGPGAQVKLKMASAADIEAANVVVHDVSTITCDIFIPFEAPVGLYDVEVTTGLGLVGTGEELFEVYEILPIVTSIEPPGGETSSYVPDITITGDNFEGPGAQVKLKMDPEPDIVAENVVVMSITTVTCDIYIPWGTAPGLYDVEVTNGNGKAGVGEALFDIIDLSPVIVSIDPDTGETGTDLIDVAIFGFNFEGPNAQVRLLMDSEPDIVATSVVVVDVSNITCNMSIPDNAALGAYDVMVMNDDGNYGVREDLFTVFTTNPIVWVIMPERGKAGEDLFNVSIMGDNFEGPNSQVVLKMAGEPDIVATSVVVVDAHSMTCDISIPLSSALGFYDVEVTNNAGKVGTGEGLFEVYELIPIVMNIYPNEASAGSDLTMVTVFGENFEGPNAEVRLKMDLEPDIVATNVVVVNVNVINCDISIPINAAPGYYDVEVTNNNGKSGIGEDLFLVTGPPPEVTGISPDSGEAGEELLGVTVTGSHFVGPGAMVFLQMPPEPDIGAMNVVVVDSSTITCDIRIPLDAALGVYDVEVVNGDAQNGVGEDLFEVLCPTPVIDSIEPDFGNQGDTHALAVISGDKFVGDAGDADVRLTMSGYPDIVCVIMDYTIDTITVIFDLTGAALGAWDVEVTNGCGGKGVLPAGYTVQ